VGRPNMRLDMLSLIALHEPGESVRRGQARMCGAGGRVSGHLDVSKAP
jgi:hypothetical protein